MENLPSSFFDFVLQQFMSSVMVFDDEAVAPKEPIYAFNSLRTKVPSLELGTWEPNESHGP